MGIFYRRPLCFFAFLYMLASVLALSLSPRVKIIFFVIAVAGLTVSLIVAALRKNTRAKSFFVAISMLSIGVAICLSYVNIDLKRAEAEKYTGERYAYMTVVSDGELLADNPSYSAYDVVIDGVRDTPLSVRATLICAFDIELYLGDKVYAFCNIFASGDSPYSFLGNIDTDGDSLLTAIIYDATDAVTDSTGRSPGFSELWNRDHSFTLMSALLRGRISEAITNTFDGDVSPLAQGVLTGDKSDMSAESVRDFKRSGVSHLLAVSGLHITLLLGAAEAFLRRLGLSKPARMVFVSLLSFALLVLTGFSMSAARAVLMLLIAYGSYMISEEPDPLTSLFCAVAVILFIWPSSVNELGLWMSFSATLGILTAYNYVVSKIPYVRGDSLLDKLKSFGRGALGAALLSICATAFVMPFLWIFFGEASLVFVAVNLILAPIVPLFLCGVPISLMLAPVPWLGDAVSFCVEALGRLILYVIRVFSKIDGASISLRYDFSAPIMVIFIISLAVGLVVKLKRKWIAFVAPVACIVLFAVSVVCFNMFGFSRSVFFYSDSKNELLCSTDDGAMSIVDVSNGSYGAYKEVINEASRVGCSYIESLVLTHLDSRHDFAVSYLLQSSLVKTLYIPSSSDAQLTLDICEVAERCGTEVKLYKEGEAVTLKGGDRFLLSDIDNIIFVFEGSSTVAYFEASAYVDGYESAALESDAVIFGAHGGMPDSSIAAESMDRVITSPEISVYINGLTAKNTSIVGSYPFDNIIKIKSDKK